MLKRWVNAESLPARDETSTSRVMYGNINGWAEHPKRVCMICGERPILRYVKTKGFCCNHLEEAWAEQAKWPMEVDWVDYIEYTEDFLPRQT